MLPEQQLLEQDWELQQLESQPTTTEENKNTLEESVKLLGYSVISAKLLIRHEVFRQTAPVSSSWQTEGNVLRTDVHIFAVL